MWNIFTKNRIAIIHVLIGTFSLRIHNKKWNIFTKNSQPISKKAGKFHKILLQFTAKNKKAP